ncbi:hypothetical protein N8224_03100 [Gammaproteobacteria bacterium]|nr:hypothetical protein [Gammaproteobacteria bacterium]
MKYTALLFIALLITVGCSTVQTYVPIVDPSSIADQTKYQGD